MFPLFFHPAPVGFAVSRIRTGDLYDLVGTNWTGRKLCSGGGGRIGVDGYASDARKSPISDTIRAGRL